MPHKTGDQLAADMLKHRPNLPVIIVSGYDADVIREKTKSIRICKYLTKPIKYDNLSHIVRQILDGETFF